MCRPRPTYTHRRLCIGYVEQRYSRLQKKKKTHTHSRMEESPSSCRCVIDGVDEDYSNWVWSGCGGSRLRDTHTHTHAHFDLVLWLCVCVHTPVTCEQRARAFFLIRRLQRCTASPQRDAHTCTPPRSHTHNIHTCWQVEKQLQQRAHHHLNPRYISVSLTFTSSFCAEHTNVSVVKLIQTGPVCSFVTLSSH